MLQTNSAVPKSSFFPLQVNSSRTKKEREESFRFPLFCVGVYLSFRAVTSQVLSARVSLTSVFGMGTGGPSPLATPTIEFAFSAPSKPNNEDAMLSKADLHFLSFERSSPRVISTSQLNMLPCVHFWPINDVVFIVPYSLMGMGELILGGVSRLDAFSVYLVRT